MTELPQLETGQHDSVEDARGRHSPLPECMVGIITGDPHLVEHQGLLAHIAAGEQHEDSLHCRWLEQKCHEHHHNDQPVLQAVLWSMALYAMSNHQPENDTHEAHRNTRHTGTRDTQEQDTCQVPRILARRLRIHAHAHSSHTMIHVQTLTPDAHAAHAKEHAPSPDPDERRETPTWLL